MSVPTLPLANEDQLNLTSSVVNTVDGDQRILTGRNHIKFSGNEIPAELAIISFGALENLYDEVKGFCTSDKDCLTALRFYFGAEMVGEKKEVKLFYQPLFLAYSATNATGERAYTVSEEGNVHSFDGTSFSIESDADLTAAQSLYQGATTLKHSTTAGTSFTGFTQGTDTESGVLPFQTIFALLNHNGTSDFTVKNCADTSGTNIQQSLILSATNNGGSGDFAGKYANRNIKNPPFLNTFSFDVV